MAEDWWQVSVLVPEERLTSAITVSSSSTQSVSQPVNSFQMAADSLQSSGKAKLFPAGGMRSGLVRLVIYSGLEEKWRHIVFFFFCFCVVAGRKAFASDCVLTPWNVSWKGRAGSGCQHRAAVPSPSSTFHAAVLMVIAYCPLQNKNKKIKICTKKKPTSCSALDWEQQQHTIPKCIWAPEWTSSSYLLRVC